MALFGSRARWARPGLAFLVGMVLLTVTLVGNLTHAAGGTDRGYDFGSANATSHGAVLAMSVQLGPGDRLVVDPDLHSMPSPGAVASCSFLILPGGGRNAIEEGREAETLARVDGLDPSRGCQTGAVTYDRPDDAPALKQSGVPAITDADRVDLVWHMPYHAEATEEDKARFAATWTGSGTPSLFRSPLAVSAGVVRAQPAFYAAEIAFGLLAVAGAAAWPAGLLRRERTDAEAPADGAEALLRLHEKAGTYLASMRDLLLASLATGAFVTLHIFVEGGPGGWLGPAQAAGLAPGLARAFTVVLVLVYAAVAVGWVVLLVHVQRALTRWRRRRGSDPLEAAVVPEAPMR